MIFLSDAEDRTIVSSFVWTKHRNVTDRQTESFWLLQWSALRAMRTRCKNGKKLPVRCVDVVCVALGCHSSQIEIYDLCAVIKRPFSLTDAFHVITGEYATPVSTVLSRELKPRSAVPSLYAASTQHKRCAGLLPFTSHSHRIIPIPISGSDYNGLP